MDRRTNDRRSVLMIVSSMLIFGTIGVFRKNIPVSSAFLAFFRGLLGGLCIFLFLRLQEKQYFLPPMQLFVAHVLPLCYALYRMDESEGVSLWKSSSFAHF